MNDLLLLTVITGRGFGEAMQELARDNGAAMTLLSAGIGTAPSEMLRMLGLGETEKDVLFSILPSDRVASAMQELAYQRHTVAFTVPVLHVMRSAAGDVAREGVCESMNSSGYEVVVVIANRGHLDRIMDAARSAGATGGTVLHARGSGGHGTEKFFGVSIAAEKELFFIVAQSETARAIMKAVDAAAGLESRAQARVFALPVSSAVGFGPKR